MSASLWAVFFLPETGGYAIEDIHQLYNGNVIRQSLRDNKYLFHIYNNEAKGAFDKEVTDVEHAKQTDEKDSSKGSEEHIDKA